MKTMPEVSPEARTLPTPLVKECLLNVGWGTEDYPTDLLLLNSQEQNIFDAAQSGQLLSEIATEQQVPYEAVRFRYRTAVGKPEALGALEEDVLTLSPLAQKIVVLNSIFDERWIRSGSLFINSNPEVILENIPRLESLLGENWKRCPQLAVMPMATVEERIGLYDNLLGSRWRSSPMILTLSQEVVEERAALYDKRFGEVWRMKPNIVTNSTKTVIGSARALEAVDITLQNTSPTAYFTLLCTTVANKRSKMTYIRTSILGHQQVHSDGIRRPLGKNVPLRGMLTPEERILESQEIEELKMFVSHLGAKGLARSVTWIKEWADARGYADQGTGN